MAPSCIFQIEDISHLREQTGAIRETVQANGFALIRGIFDRSRIRAFLPTILQYISQTEALPSSGVSAEQIRRNCLKWSIGSQSQSQSGIARLMMTIMNPTREPDVLGLRDTFTSLILVRDTLAQREQPLLDDYLPAPKFNGTRLQIYPAGGGFMTRHIDSRAIDNVRDVSAQYIQLVLLMTEKGTDYTSGGAFVEVAGEFRDSEANARSGDIVVYDANTMHGVADIDSHKPLDTSGAGARIVALATVYD
ncbi:hypothetical protein [Viridibacterium curvum]|uniref:2OG-Fe(II) oxygenase n=1 Tax=Viridibacterium curvum TaxID=1101404 RepID=A0ABP9R0Q9_9RHOO